MHQFVFYTTTALARTIPNLFPDAKHSNYIIHLFQVVPGIAGQSGSFVHNILLSHSTHGDSPALSHIWEQSESVSDLTFLLFNLLKIERIPIKLSCD